MEEELRDSEQTIKAILSTSPVGIALINGPIMGWANDASRRMVGYDYGELEGRSLRALYRSDADFRRATRNLYIRRESEMQWIRKDGTTDRCADTGSAP